MPAYIIVEVDVTNPDRFEEYRPLVPATLEPYGGKFIVRGGASETLEGDWTPKRMVVIEFPDVESAKGWWGSDIYEGPKKIRQESADTRMIVVEGLS